MSPESATCNRLHCPGAPTGQFITMSIGLQIKRLMEGKTTINTLNAVCNHECFYAYRTSDLGGTKAD